MRKYFIRYIRHQINLFKKHYLYAYNPGNREAIHDYRVSLKRIRLLMKYLGEISETMRLRNAFKKARLNKVFKTGGILREIQINRKLLKEYENKENRKFRDFRFYMKKKEVKARRKFREVWKKFSFRRLYNFRLRLIRAYTDTPESFITEHLDIFLNNRLQQIENLVKDKEVENHLHRIRKLTKDIKYLLELSELSKKDIGSLKLNIERITLLEDLIGKWHDYLVFKEECNAFEEYLIKRNADDKHLIYSELREHVSSDYSELYNQTVEKIYEVFEISRKKNL